MTLARAVLCSLASALLPRQTRALAWMLHREGPDAKPALQGGLLANDQGMDKTITTTALLLSHSPPNGLSHAGQFGSAPATSSDKSPGLDAAQRGS